MTDDRVRYYFALLQNEILIKHGLMLHEEAWFWSQQSTPEPKGVIRFYNKEDYEKFLKKKVLDET